MCFNILLYETRVESLQLCQLLVAGCCSFFYFIFQTVFQIFKFGRDGPVFRMSRILRIFWFSNNLEFATMRLFGGRGWCSIQDIKDIKNILVLVYFAHQLLVGWGVQY